MERANQLEQEENLKEAAKIRSDNYSITSFFKNKVNEPKLENYPYEVNYYLLNEKEKINALNSEIENSKWILIAIQEKKF